MWRVILDIVLLAIGIPMGVANFKRKQYKGACVDFFFAGWFLCCILWHVDVFLLH